MIASSSHKDRYLFKHRGYLGDKILEDNLVLQHSNSLPSLKFELISLVKCSIQLHFYGYFTIELMNVS